MSAPNPFSDLEALHNEADVEQKLVWPLLTTQAPAGLAIPAQSIFIKSAIKRLKIDKGGAGKLYYPDYAISVLGLPVMIVEVKSPGMDLTEARREARLYAAEINASYPTETNPCQFCVVSNGEITELRKWDSEEAIATFTLAQANPANEKYSNFADLVSIVSLRKIAAELLGKFRPHRYWRPVNLVGGTSSRDERIEFNEFGKLLTSHFQNLFNPNTWEDRQRIVQTAYVASKRRQRYIDEIDHIIKVSAPPIIQEAELIEDTSEPVSITRKFSSPHDLRNKILLLIGAVGSGKSTFVDYLQEVALPVEVKSATAWVRIDLNEAPISPDEIYNWCREQLIVAVRDTSPDMDLVSLEGLRKLYKNEILNFESGVGALFPKGSVEHNARLADLLTSLQNDRAKTLRCLERCLCTGRGRLLVIGLDNCDKRNRDEQLLMFQVAKWLQQEIRSLIILPLRQETFENHRNEPPLDTALQDLTFRIQAPPFQEILTKRLKLILVEARKEGARSLSYNMSGVKVTISVDKLERFLRQMMSALFDNRRHGRNIIIGLAGWNIRRAFEIFLDFCKSGYLSETEIFESQAKGENPVLPPSVVARILFRTSRRFYNGDKSYVKNLFQCDPGEENPDHFVRYKALSWLRRKAGEKGDSGIKGFHRLGRVIHSLVATGLDERAARTAVLYLLKEGCILSEHLRADLASDDDLLAITPAGHVHLELAHYDIHYIAACAEDCWLADERLAREIHRKITLTPMYKALSWSVTLETALSFVNYLHDQQTQNRSAPLFLEDEYRDNLDIDLDPVGYKIDQEISHREGKTGQWQEKQRA